MTVATPAERLLQELGVTEPNEIDVNAIAWHCGAEVIYRPLDGCEAQIIGVGERAKLIVNECSPVNRRRFSVGHELGHWHYHHGESLLCRAIDITDQKINRVSGQERVANVYAADLLLPGYIFQPIANQYSRITIEAVEELANLFNTSLTATAIRLAEVGSDMILLICYGRNGRKWFVRGPDVPERWFPPEEIGTYSSALEILFGKKRKSSPDLVDASIWFDWQGAGQVKLYEQSIKIGNNEILTLLVFKDGEMLKFEM